MSTSNTHEYWKSAKDRIENGFPESNRPESDKIVTPHMAGLADNADQYRDTHIPTFDDVKKALTFLVAQNAQLRVEGGSSEEAPLSDGFHNRLQGILTNDICDTFAEHMQGVQRQTEPLPPTGVEGSPVITDMNNVPKAPRAMLISERVRLLEVLLLKDQKKTLNGAESQNPTPPGLHTSLPAALIPSPFPSTPNPASILDNNHQTNTTAPVSARPATAEIGIPLDPQFLAAFKSTEQEEGEIRSSSITPAPTKGSSDDSMRANRATDESGRPRRSSSAERPRHRLPSSRTYRCSRSPESRRRRRSPSRRTPPRSSRRSPSPSYTKRTYSPDRRYNRRSPSPRADRRYRRAPPSPTRRPPRPSESKPVPSTSRRRSSEYDASLSKPRRYEPTRANTLPELGSPNGTRKTRHPQRPDHERNISVETTSLDYGRPNHERRNGEEKESDAHSPRGLPNQSMSPSIKDASHRFEGRDGGGVRVCTPTEDIVMKERSPTTTSDVSMGERTPTLSQPAQEQESMEGPSLPKPPGSPMHISKMPCHSIPGLWMVTSGLETVEILSCEFEIDKIIAERWGVRRSSRHGKEKEHDSLSLKLACVPLIGLEAVQTKLGKSAANPEEFGNAVDRLEILWPPSGHLVIEVNPDRDWGRSWLPRHLEEDRGAIEIIDHVHEGTNVIRFIQLAGLNNFTFLVVAKVKPPDFYCLEPESTIPLSGEGGKEVEDSRTDDDRLLKDFLASIQITYS